MLSRLLIDTKEFRAAALAHAVTRRRSQEEVAAARLADLSSGLAELERQQPAVVVALRPMLEEYARLMARVTEELGSVNRNRGVNLYQNEALALEARIKAAVAEPMAAARTTTSEAAAAVQASKVLLLQRLVAAGLVVALTVGALAISMRRALTSFGRIRQAMETLAAGRIDTETEGLNRRDEIGAMARSVEVFRANGIEKRRMEATAAEERGERDRRQELAATLTRDFAATIGGVLGSLGEAAATMRRTAGSMSGAAGRTRQHATEVAEAAAGSAEELEHVAAAAEVMLAGTEEMTREVRQAVLAITETVALARGTIETVEALRAVADKIGGVIDVIGRIAGQTNLLALNATIEASRAGEAGRGFAVVAQEVKALASETAQASESVVRHIEAVRHSTAGAGDSIARIGSAIEALHVFAERFSNAVAQQGSATREIVEKVQGVATVTRLASDSVTTVRADSEVNALAAQDVLGAAEGVAREAAHLGEQVNAFIGSIGRTNDRRSHERDACDLLVGIEAAGAVRQVRMTEIAPCSARLAADLGLPPGHPVLLRIPGRPVALEAEVARAAAGHTGLLFREEVALPEHLRPAPACAALRAAA